MMSADNSTCFRTNPLTLEYIPFLESLEDAAGLPFWGCDNYRRFLEELPEYFGFCLISDGTEKRLDGFSLARAVFEDLELLKIGVAPEFQRLGFGSLLLEDTIAEGNRRGATRCFLEVRKSNQTAILFYSMHDFQISGARVNYYSNPVEDAWIMDRRII